MNWPSARPRTFIEITLAMLLVIVLAFPRTGHCFQDYTTCGKQKVPLSGEVAIVGGKPAQVGEWPWQAQMLFQGRGICGASLVHPQWILSAAHCVSTLIDQPQYFAFKMGSNKYEGGGANTQIRAADKVFMHPNYTIYNTDHDSDVALFKLDNPFDLNDYVQPVCVPTADMADSFQAGTQVTVTGWGSTGDGSSYSEDLLEVSVPIVDQECKSAYNAHNIIITDNMVCAGKSDGGKDSCQGDSGGPMVAKTNDKWFQVGVVSFGIGCALAEYPGVYARMTAFQDWIAPIFEGKDPDRQDSNCTDRSEYKCLLGGCIPYDAKCDGVHDCYTGSDENANCDFPVSMFDITESSYRNFKLTNDSIRKTHFAPTPSECAVLCLAFSTCVAFDFTPNFALCDLAEAGYSLMETIFYVQHYVLGKLKDPLPVMNTSAHHGFIGYPVQLLDPAGSLPDEFVWNIAPKDLVNTIRFRFTGFHTDEEVSRGSPCENYLLVGGKRSLPVCLYQYTGAKSFTWSVLSNQTSVKLQTTDIFKSSFVAEYTAEFSHTQAINVDSSGGEITTPNYPQVYSRLLNYRVFLRAPYGRQVELTVGDFDKAICLAGYDFEIYDMQDGVEGIPLKILGNCYMDMPTSVVTSKGEMLIKLITNRNSYSPNIGGFRLRYALSDDSGKYKDLENDRNTMQSALIGVGVGAGVVILCLVAVVLKLSTKQGSKSRPSVQATQNNGNVIAVQPVNQRAANVGEDNRAFNI
ncbi:uncharacterized protein LOC110981891 isoform X2 [Acanthaster planci]|uniref:Uncharacterized protein LOC110981891 isoform X2 n=1 Tax=Acanthaster planci TaxID=133434 RepID=A0A8B7YSZ0_ACAPL|nr:uncharacterized protein LOC110981891 isoform X2 [Acanthaster planci]